MAKTVLMFVLGSMMSAVAIAGAVTVHPAGTDEAFPNPMKGFRPDTNRRALDKEYARVTRCYIHWNDIEDDESDGEDKIRAWCDEHWRVVTDRGLKVIPRVTLAWRKGGPNGSQLIYYFPKDLEPGVWEGEKFERRLVRMIERMGRCWDNDPRVAWIHMGLIGTWAEHHSPSISPRLQKIMGDAFDRAFKNKRILVRCGGDFPDRDYGFHWDSWAHEYQWSHKGVQCAPSILARIEKGAYLRNPIEGEVAYDWGKLEIQPGRTPEESLSMPVHTDFLEMTIRTMHCTALGWVADYKATNELIRAGAARIQKAFGYRYVVDEATFDDQAKAGGEWKASVTVRNVGSAPFYCDWPVTAALVEKVTGRVVWEERFNTDVRTWACGEHWDDTAKRYTVPAPAMTFGSVFRLPDNLKPGTYIWTLAILDPSTRQPAVRLAMRDVLPQTLRHPLGEVKVLPN